MATFNVDIEKIWVYLVAICVKHEVAIFLSTKIQRLHPTETDGYKCWKLIFNINNEWTAWKWTRTNLLFFENLYRTDEVKSFSQKLTVEEI